MAVRDSVAVVVRLGLMLGQVIWLGALDALNKKKKKIKWYFIYYLSFSLFSFI